MINKIITALLSVILMSFAGIRLYGADASEAFVTIQSDSGGKIYFQPESDAHTGYIEVTPGIPIKIEIDSPAYYYYMGSNGKFHTTYITPGANITLTERSGEVSFGGTHAEINRFIAEHPVFIGVPQEILPYSAAWCEYMNKKVDEKIKEIESSSLPDEFKKNHSIYHRMNYIHQLLTGPALLKGFMGKEVDLPKDFYKFLQNLRLDDPAYLSYPKWFSTLMAAFEQMEKEGFLPVHATNYLSLYANRITNKELRSEFLLRYIHHAQQKGFSTNFENYLALAENIIKTEKELKQLAVYKEEHNKQKERFQAILPGCKAPAFAGTDVSGKKYESSMFAGKVVVLDFWFSGCTPCKMEMPFMEKLAEEFRGKEIIFVSASLDSGEPLLNAWKQLVRKKENQVLNINIPDGFKSNLAQEYCIKGVPRIVVIDAQGNIADAFAKRPSDPKFQKQLESLLGISREVTREECNHVLAAIMQAPNALTKESIFREFQISNSGSKSPLIANTAGMLQMQVIQAYLLEGERERAGYYLSGIPESLFKRDILFLCGNKLMEEGENEKAFPLIEQAALLTEKLSGTDTTADETNKFPLIFGAYSQLLVEKGEIAKAAPAAKRAFQSDQRADFKILSTYIQVLMYQKEYTHALSLLESLIKEGKENAELEANLKECWLAIPGNKSSFVSYRNELKEHAMNALKKKLAKKMLSEPAPDFILLNLDGKEVCLSSLKGKVVILDFWATWCGPCKALFPAMQKTVNKYGHHSDVEFLFIHTLESGPSVEGAVRKYLSEKGYNFNVLFDKCDQEKKHPVFEQFGSKGIPAKYILDKKGNIRFKSLGFSGSEEEAVAELSAMIDILL